MHVSSLLSLLNSCSLDPVRDYKAIGHIPKNDVLRMYALFVKHTCFCIKRIYIILQCCPKSELRENFSLGNCDSGIELPF